MAMEIIEAQSPEQIDQARALFNEYAAGMGIDLCFQNFSDEVNGLPGAYAAPSGRLLLVVAEETPAGCIALRKLADDICEMKRLYVKPEFRGHGVGRILTETIIALARQLGYHRMRLDTLPGIMDPAIAMYRAFGFVEIEPYYHNPVEGALFMELEL